MASIKYTPTEQALISYDSHMSEIPIHQLEALAESLDNGETIWVAIELGRCPSTDHRTYILHTSYDKPTFDYYGAEPISLETLK